MWQGNRVLNLPLQVSIMTVMKMEFMNVFVVERICLIQRPNLTQELGGQVSGNLLQMKMLKNTKTEAMV